MEFEIIDFVKANPILYQRKFNNNASRPLKMQKWRELSELLGADPKIVRNKWRNLREGYRKQRRAKAKEFRDEVDALGSFPCSKYYNHLSFLKTEYENEEDLEEDISENCLDDSDACTGTKIVSIEIENLEYNQNLGNSDHKASTANAAHNYKSSIDVEDTQPTKKARKDAAITEACREMAALLQKAKQNCIPPSHNQVFFNSVALQVEQAQLSPMDLMRLQQRVLELITQEICVYQDRTFNVLN